MEDSADIAGTLNMETANFSVNGFSGGLSSDAAFTAATGFQIDGSSSYGGAFYGPEAEEIGGVIEATGTDDEGESWNAIGFFTGDIGD